MEADPQTVAKRTSSVNNHFERLFIAYGCCINGFLLGCRPILYIDGCHLSGPYLGTLLVASTYDADNNLYPLAYTIVNGETYEDWSWFLRNLKEFIGSLQITIVSDRHNAIVGAVREVFGGSRHTFCYRHIKENFSAEFSKVCNGHRRKRKEDVLKLLDKIAYSRSDLDFVKAMGHLRSFSIDLARWVETQSDVDKWAMSRFQFRRWDNITTNLAESFNAWLVKERRDNVCVLINEHRQKLAKKLYVANEAMGKWENGVGPKIEAILKENVAQAEGMVVVDHGSGRMLVRIGQKDLRVNVALRECTCQAWQMTGIPCPHACAAIKNLHGNVYTYVEECYLLSSQQKIYMNTMIPVETHDMPNLNQLSLDDYRTNTFLQPPITSRPPGRPKKKRRDSQFQHQVQYQCSRCHQSGHNRASCTNLNPTEL
ncbi:hypothetical protein QN277_008669 [Acacia crassicarpa]|uniref:SWIM-type domain-containing protein n=2 Tax=Acacia crassicarpa TaxID=499986 RepID=A0AAE1IRL5_9FABA|nr:hypothetical protein QN277_008669 [Acacia crassicarpa]